MNDGRCNRLYVTPLKMSILDTSPSFIDDNVDADIRSEQHRKDIIRFWVYVMPRYDQAILLDNSSDGPNRVLES